MRGVIVMGLAWFIASSGTSLAFADTFVVNFHELDGNPLVGSGGRHNTLVVYQEVRGSQVNNLANNVFVNAPKLRNPIVVMPAPIDLDDDGQITFDVTLDPNLGNRTIVTVAQRFDEAFPSTALPFVIVSLDNLGRHVLDVAVPRVTVSAPAPSYRAPPSTKCPPRRCFLFRRRS